MVTKLTTLAAVLGFVAMVGFIGCGGSATDTAAEQATEQVVEQATGEQVDVDASSVDINELAEFLRYPGATATAKVSMSGEKGSGSVWTLETADDQATVADWYRKSLEAQSWTKGAEMDTDGSLMLMYATADETQNVAVLISTEEGKTTISITHLAK